MPFEIEGDAMTALVAQLPEAAGVTKSEALRRAATAELVRLCNASEPLPLRMRFALLRACHPLPEPTGLTAEKTFFDDLSAS